MTVYLDSMVNELLLFTRSVELHLLVEQNYSSLPTARYLRVMSLSILLRDTNFHSIISFISYTKINYILTVSNIFTVRNEVPKVMFLQACVCPRGGVPDQVHPPPRTRYTPQTRYPRDQVQPRDQVYPPRPGAPPGTRYTPRDTATAADGAHPTGMHSCCTFLRTY